MKPLTLCLAVAAATLCAGASASAQVVNSAVNICEVAADGGSVNTVRLNLFSFGDVYLEYTFRTQPTGPTYQFPTIAPTSSAAVRKFALPAGTYKVSYKAPNNPAVGVYGQNVVVRPYQVRGQTCVFISPRNRAAAAEAPRN